MDYDLIVVGGGAGGLSAARAGVRGGHKVLLINEGPLGGDCTFTGCVPSKTLIEGAAQGLSFDKVTDRVREVVAEIAATEDAGVLRSEGVHVIDGRARFSGQRRLSVGTEQLTAPRIVIATGSTAMLPEIEGLRGVEPLTNESVFHLAVAPRSFMIIGGGPIGCELAQAYRRLGVGIVLVEAGEGLLPREEPEVGTLLGRLFVGEGIDVRLRTSVARVQRVGPDCIKCSMTDGSDVEVDRVLVAAGRQPVTDGLDVAAGGIELDHRGFVRTDDHLATTAPGVFGVGDVTGQLPFTHAADEMGRIAVANAFSRLGRHRFDVSAVPWVTFTEPEVARVGISEVEAAAVGGRVAYLPMTELDRAITADRTEGFVKLIAGPRRLTGQAGGGKILGATVMSERAGELIHEVALAMRTGMFTGRLAQTVHAYPTWSMAIRQAAGQFFMTTGGRDARPAVR